MRSLHSASPPSRAAVATYVTASPDSFASRAANALFPERAGPVTKVSGMLLNLVCAAAGILLILATLRDIFLAVILPRAANLRWRIGVFAIRLLWRFWPRFALTIRDENRRE